MVERIRIVVAGSGAGSVADDHERGAQQLARALRDAGAEVVYTGPEQTPGQIVQTVVQEDADAVGLSVPVGVDRSHLRRVVELLADHDASDVVVKIFTPRATTDEIVDWVRTNVAPQSVG